MCSLEGLHDLQNEKYMVSYLGIAQLLLSPAILEYLSTVDKSPHPGTHLSPASEGQLINTVNCVCSVMCDSEIPWM